MVKDIDVNANANANGSESDQGFVKVIPVSFVLALRPPVSENRWAEPQWSLVSLVVTGDVHEPTRELISAPGDVEKHYLWRGFAVRLFVDAGESYWFSLQSDNPRLFVICEIAEDEIGIEDGELKVVQVTASQDEAMSHMETDDHVFSWPMPPEVAVNLERFVVATYEPQIKKKRRRRNWSNGGSDQPNPPVQGGEGS